MGRRHLIEVAALALAGAVAVPAGAAITWRQIVGGAAAGGYFTVPFGDIALDRSQTGRFSARVGSTGMRDVRKLDFARDAAVAVFGPWGCEDDGVHVRSIAQRNSTLDVTLVEASSGRIHCMAIFETYRVLAVAKSMLRRPLPTHVSVKFARA